MAGKPVRSPSEVQPNLNSGYSRIPTSTLSCNMASNSGVDDATQPTEILDNPGNIEPLLAVDEPEVHRGKGRPVGSKNKRQRTVENSSQRNPSDFEHIESSINASRGGRGRERGRGQSRESRDGITSTQASTAPPTSTAPTAMMTAPFTQQDHWRGRGGGTGMSGIPAYMLSTLTFN